MSEKKFSKHNLLIVGAIVLAFFLRFYHLGVKGLWGDEIWTAIWSQPGLVHIVKSLTRPPDMPLMYALVHISTRIGGSEFWVRLPSALFGSLGVFFIYLIARVWFDRRVGLVAAFLFALSAIHIWYSQDARYYGVLTTLGLATTLALYLAITDKNKAAIYWIGFTILSIASIYTHLFAFWFIFSLILFAAIKLIRDWKHSGADSLRPQDQIQRDITLFALSLVTIFVFVLPVLIMTFNVLQSGVGPTGEGLAKLTFPPKIPYFFTQSFFAQLVQYWSSGRTLSFFMLPLFALGLYTSWKQIRGVFLLVILLFATPFISSLLIEFIHNIAFKYFVYLTPFYLVIVAKGITTITQWIKAALPARQDTSQTNTPLPRKLVMQLHSNNMILIVVIVALALLHITPLRLLYQQAKTNDWRSISSFYDKHVEPGDVILTEKWGRAALAYYFTRQNDVSVLPVDADLLNMIDTLGGKVWFIGLNGATEKQIRLSYAAIPKNEWHNPNHNYLPPPGSTIEYPVTKEYATLYMLQDNGAPSSVDFHDIRNVAWTDKSYREIMPGQEARIRLMKNSDQPSQLIVNYLDQKDRDFELLLDGETLGIVRTGSSGAWAEHEILIPDLNLEELQISILAKGPKSAAINSLALMEPQNQINPQNPQPTPHSVWIVGDSLTRGLFASSEATTYRNLLFSTLRNEHPGEIHTTFWSGVVTLGGLEQRWDQFAGLPDLIFIELGINDLGRNPDFPQVPEEEWQARFGAMLDRIQQDAPGVKIIVGTVPWSGWPSENLEYQLALKYNNWISIEARQRNIAVADLWAATVGKEDGLSTPDQPSIFPPYHHGDNFHPNDTGHRRIAETFFQAYR